MIRRFAWTIGLALLTTVMLEPGSSWAGPPGIKTYGVETGAGPIAPAWEILLPFPGAGTIPASPNFQGADYGSRVHFVNTSRGNLTFTWEDLSIGGAIPLYVERVYDSEASGNETPEAPRAGDFGPGWWLKPGSSILVSDEGDRLIVNADDGRAREFVRDSNGLFVPVADSPDVPWRQIRSTPTGTLDASLDGGYVETFSPTGKPGEFLFTGIRDLNGNWTRLTWIDGKLIRMENNGGAFMEVIRDPSVPGSEPPGRVTSIRDSAGRGVSYSYDAAGRLVESIAPGGVVTRWEYDLEGRLTAVRDVEGRLLFGAAYDADGHVERFLTASGQATFEYDIVQSRTEVRFPTGSLTTFHHDPTGRTIRVVDPLGYENRVAYGPGGDIEEHRDALGHTVRYSFEQHLLNAIIFPDGTSTQYEHDSEGRLTRVVNPLGKTTSLAYDERGNLVRETDATEKEWTAEYDLLGNLTAFTDPLGRKTLFESDALGRRTKILKPDGGVWELGYDGPGRLRSILRPDEERVEMEFDAAGNYTGHALPGTPAERYEYDPSRRLVAVVDAAGGRTTIAHDDAGRTVAVTDPSVRTISYEYDAAGRLTAVLRSDGTTTRFGYDARGLPAWTTDPAGEMIEFHYDGTGRLIEKVFEGGRSIIYVYDVLGRLVTRRMPGGAEDLFTYDEAGNLTAVRGPNLDLDVDYDAAGRVRRLSRPGAGKSVAFSYDAAGNRSEMIEASGTWLTYEYDSLDRLVAVNDDLRGRYEIEYDPVSRSRSRLRTPYGLETTFNFDRVGRLSSYGVQTETGQVLEAESYTRDEVGRIRRIERFPSRTFDITYDPAGRRLSAVADDGRTVLYEYDVVGRAVSRESPEGLVAYFYDTAGRLLRMETPEGPYSFTWTAAEDVKAWREGSSLAPDGRLEKLTWGYDGLPRRWERSDATAVEYRWYPDSTGRPSSVIEQDGSGSRELQWIYHRSSPVAEFDPGTGLVLNMNELDAIGADVASSAPGISLKSGWTEPGSQVALLTGSVFVNDYRLRTVWNVGSSVPLSSRAIGFGQLSAALQSIRAYAYASPFTGMESIASPRAAPSQGMDLAQSPSGQVLLSHGPAGIDAGGPLWETTTAGEDYVIGPSMSGAGRAYAPGGVGRTLGGASIESLFPVVPNTCDRSVCGSVCPDDCYSPTDCEDWFECIPDDPRSGDGDGGGGGGGGGGDDGGGDVGGGCGLDCGVYCPLSVSPPVDHGLVGDWFSFSASTPPDCVNTASWSAPAGDPYYGSGPSFGTRYWIDGTFHVRATAYGQTVTAKVYVYRPCTFEVSVSPNSPYVGDPVQLTASGDCSSYDWNGGTSACPASGSGTTWSTRFTHAGSQEVQITGDNGHQYITPGYLSVSVQPCSVTASGPTSGVVQTSLCYTAVPTGASSGTYMWQAPGGNPSAGSGPGFCTTFPAAGSYTVTPSLLKTVTGCSSVLCESVPLTVSITPPPPNVRINLSGPTGVLVGDSATVSATGLDGYGNPTAGSYTWTTSDASALTISPNGNQVEIQGAGAGASTLSVVFQSSSGSASDQVTVHVVDVNVEQIDFTGLGCVDIRIDGNIDIDTPGGGLNDIEWTRGTREGPNDHSPWDTTQAAPAAFVKGNPLSARVTLSAQPTSVSAVVVRGTSVGPYGDLASSSVPLTSGTGTGEFTSVATGPATVDVNNLVVTWRLQSVTVSGVQIPLQANLTTTVNRVYTLYAAPSAPMAEPWATVLELAAGIAKGVGTDVGIVEEMTRGIHYSKGLTFRTDARFLDPRATLVYDPNYSRTIPVGPPDNLFGAQYYNLEDFMIYLSQFQDVQQCNDNSNLLGGVLLHAVGIPMDPLWLAHNYDLWDTDPNNNDTGDLLVEATYYPAGSTVQQGPLSFRFHQFGFFAGKVYDPSIRPNPMGDPYIGMSLADYLNAAFPGQSGEGYIWRLVTDIRISPGASASWDSGELVSLQGQAEE